MLLRISCFLLMTLLVVTQAFPQGADAKLTGKVLDQEGSPLAFTTVVVYEGELVRHGTQTNEEGVFSIQPIAPGTYRVEARYLGKTKALDNVSVIAGQTRDITLAFSEDVASTLGPVEIFGNPVFEKDPAVTTTFTGEDVQNLGTRSVNTVAALTAGVYQSDEGGTINIRGARSSSTVYYIDGVKVRGQTTLPQNSISQLQVITGGTPAEFGDFTGGVVNITTANPSPDFSGQVELVTSEYLDNFGRNLAALSVSGPIITKKRTLEGTDTEYKTSVLGFFLNGEVKYDRDQDPAARGIYKVSDPVLADLQETPVQISPDGNAFLSRANYLTGDQIEPIVTKPFNTDLRARGLLRFDFQPAENVLIKVGGNYEYILSDLWGLGSMLFQPDHQGVFEGHNGRAFVRFQQSFSGGKNSKIRNIFYSIQGDYSFYYRRFQNRVHRDNLFDYGHVGKFEFDEVPFYSYVNDPINDPLYSGDYWRTIGYGFNNLSFDGTDSRNPILANYNETIFDYAAQNDGPPLRDLIEFAFRQGILNGRTAPSIYSISTGIGNTYGGFQKTDYEQFRLTGQATAEVGKHNLKLGFEFEQRVERFYGTAPRALWGWMRQYANFHLTSLETDPSKFTFVTDENGVFQDTVIIPRFYSASEQRNFDRNLRQKLGLPVDGTDWVNIDALPPEFFSLDMFTANELLADGLGPVGYYGFDYLGNRQRQVDPNEFFTDLNNRPQNPFSPTYISAFIQDKFEFEDINFNVGLRVDRFDANQPVLKDNFVLYPTFTAAEVASGNVGGISEFQLPNGIGSDFVPYVNDAANPTDVIGYRSGETWFDVNGAPVSSNEIARNSAGGKPQPAIREDSVSINSFTDYSPQTTFMPRISFSFPISDQAIFFAHYDVLAQRPGQLLTTQPSLMAGQLSDFVFLENRPTSTVTNPNLRPEVTIDYEAGFKQKVGQRMAFSISAYYRELRNMVRFRRFANAFPFSYDTYDNLDFGTVKGFSFSFDMRRTANLAIRASYTLQFADATGSNFTSARNVVNFLEGVGVLRETFPVDNDQRHRITGNIDYRFTGKNSGPGIKGKKRTHYPLRDFGVNLTFYLGSGTPYTRNAVAVPSIASGINIVNQINGIPNGARLPWQARFDLQFNKTFALNQNKEGGSPMNFNVYLLFLNVLNTANVVRVYRYTGLPDDDGWLASDSGEQVTISQISPEAYVDQYTARVQNPSNFSVPRRIRLGVMFNF